MAGVEVNVVALCSRRGMVISGLSGGTELGSGAEC